MGEGEEVGKGEEAGLERKTVQKMPRTAILTQTFTKLGSSPLPLAVESTTLNKLVYAPDGTYHGPPLGAWHSLSADGLHPCVTFKAPPPPAAPKKRSWDVVSEELILPGKRARKERVRSN